MSQLDPTLKRYKAVIEYDGTNYFGYQYQPTMPTIQGELEKALCKICQTPIRVHGAGRTDTGVHATGQVIAFDTAWQHGLPKLQQAFNAVLPNDIVVQQIGVVSASFSPRFDALSRTYRYTILNQPYPIAVNRFYSYHVKKNYNCPTWLGPRTI